MRKIILGFVAMAASAQVLMPVAAQGPSSCSLSYTTSLAAWYKADAGLTCTGGCTNGNPVTAWADQSGNSNTAVAGTAGTFQSAQINGLPAVQFVSASSQFYTLTNGIDFSSAGSGAATIFAIVKLTTSGTVFSSLHASTLDYWFGKSSHEQGADSAGVVNIGNGTTASGTSWVQANLVFVNGTSYAFRLNRSSDGSGTTSVTLGTSFKNQTIGVNLGSSEFLNGLIAELLIFNSNIGSGNITTVENYLNCRYGL